MALQFPDTLRNAKINQVGVAVDAGAGPGMVRIYDGARPAPGGAVTVLLAELDFSDPSFLSAVAGVLTADAIADEDSAPNAGTATWFRAVDSNSVFVIDGDAGSAGTDLILNSAVIALGAKVSINSFVLTEGNA